MSYMSSLTDVLVSYMAAHALATFAIIFAVAAGEAILVLGLFVPSTVVLIGAGALVGAGKLPFLPVFALTTAGAIVGDAISFWLGRRYRFRILAMWPFARYPALLQKGEAFFEKYGGSSVFLGRFIPGVKSVIPGVAGMMGLSVGRFYVINVVSAIVWAAAHILPGTALGKGLTSVDLSSPRTAAFAVAAVVAAWVVYRIVAKTISARTSADLFAPAPSGSNDDEMGQDRTDAARPRRRV